jgi:hypothetical protein
MQLAIAFGLIAITVLIHALGTVETITYASRVLQRKRHGQNSLAAACRIVRIVSVLLVLHLVEAGVWALYYWAVELLPDLETAFYFSLTSYTTVGYGDVVLPGSSRYLGPMEAAVGILMFGWSTGIIVTTMHRLYRLQLGPPDEDEGEGSGSDENGRANRLT